MAEPKKSNREKVKEIVSSIETGIQDLFQSEKFVDYLRTMSKFHSYSYRNTILIHMQRPEASRVAGFNAWKTKFGRHVKKGEKGITILAPTPFKKKIEEMKLDPDTKAPVLDSNGNAIIEEKEVEIPMFRPVKVFDVSQTEGEPLPSLVSDLTGNVQHYEAFMEALRRSSPVPISIKPLEPTTDGFFRFSDQTITIREGMSQVQTVCAAIHEITHAKLHNREKDRLSSAAGDTDREPPKKKDKNTMEAIQKTTTKPNMLIDIQAKMQQAHSPGFERWAKTFNLKEMAKTVMYLQEKGLTDLGELEKACDAAVQKFNDLSDRTKAASARMKEISELQKHIGAYGRTREIYAQFRKLTGRKRDKFYEQHSSEIASCQEAKRYFNSLGLKKLPSMQSLKQEYAMLQTENKKRYSEYKQARAEMMELLTAQNNVERILGVTEKEKNRDRQHGVR